jgi:hypothetical protein
MTETCSDTLVSADPVVAARMTTPQETALARLPRKPDVMVPIRSLGENHRARISRHLKALDPHDR